MLDMLSVKSKNVKQVAKITIARQTKKITAVIMRQTVSVETAIRRGRGSERMSGGGSMNHRRLTRARRIATSRKVTERVTGEKCLKYGQDLRIEQCCL